MDNYIEIVLHKISPQQIEMLIAQLADAGYEGFEENENELKAFIPKDQFEFDLVNELATSHDLQFDQHEIEQQNWNEVWESNFQPIVVNDFVAVRAEFHKPITHVKNEIIITPKMSFGTGHHATTKMMMMQMGEIDFTNKSVFDFGTGTGILAILAEKLGASTVFAVDIDEWSIENAKENIQRNQCDRVVIEKSDTAGHDGHFDIILANIVKNVILENVDLMLGQLKQGGILLISGLLPEDEADILDCAKKRSLIVDKKMQENNWICLRFLY